MPPNPARQAAMAQKRAEYAADPRLQEAAEEAGRAVLDSYDTPNETGPSRNPGPSRPASSGGRAGGGGARGSGGGGGSMMKQNYGRKGALPPPEFDIKLFNYSAGGKVTDARRDPTRGQFRSGGSTDKPGFAVGGGVLNKKSYRKGD